MNTILTHSKTARRGQVHTPRQRREELLAEFARSGLSISKFAALVGVHYQTFWSWLQQDQKQRTAAEPAAVAKPVRFAEVVRTGTALAVPLKALRVLLPSGAVIEVADAAQAEVAAQLLKALA